MRGESSDYDFAGTRAYPKRPVEGTPQEQESTVRKQLEALATNSKRGNKRPLEIAGTPARAALPSPQQASALATGTVTPAMYRQWRGKRTLDVVGAFALATMFFPLILTFSLWLSLTGGPVLFGHTRIGQGGKPFICYKFRTMVPDADRILRELFETTPDLQVEWILDQKLRDDPRITRIGHFLRKASLDELPQLWNVFKGEMSLVGPRPIVQEEIYRYGLAFRHYLAVKPGITGLWQISGRNSTGYRRRVALDRIYATRSTFGMDMRILLRTAIVVVGQRGAY